jgi:hypothetical protein
MIRASTYFAIAAANSPLTLSALPSFTIGIALSLAVDIVSGTWDIYERYKKLNYQNIKFNLHAISKAKKILSTEAKWMTPILKILSHQRFADTRVGAHDY